MSQQKLLITVVRELERLQIPYMITGSLVSSLQGEPRATHDIDIVVAIQPSQARALANVFQMPDYYLDEQTASEAAERKSMFSLLEVGTGDKVDFWLLTDDEFDQSRFQRRSVERLFGKSIYVSSPEDTVLMKLKWAKMAGGSEKQFGDCLRIYEVQRENLDVAYLWSWAKKLDIHAMLSRLVDQAQP